LRTYVQCFALLIGCARLHGRINTKAVHSPNYHHLRLRWVLRGEILRYNLRHKNAHKIHISNQVVCPTLYVSYKGMTSSLSKYVMCSDTKWYSLYSRSRMCFSILWISSCREVTTYSRSSLKLKNPRIRHW